MLIYPQTENTTNTNENMEMSTKVPENIAPTQITNDDLVTIVYNTNGIQLTNKEAEAIAQLMNNDGIRIVFKLKNIDWREKMMKYIIFHIYLQDHNVVYKSIMETIENKLQNVGLNMNNFQHIPRESWIFLVGTDIFFQMQSGYFRYLSPVMKVKDHRNNIEKFEQKKTNTTWSFMVNPSGKTFYDVPDELLPTDIRLAIINNDPRVTVINKSYDLQKCIYYNFMTIYVEKIDIHEIYSFVHSLKRDANGIVNDLKKRYGSLISQTQTRVVSSESPSPEDQYLISTVPHMTENIYIGKQGPNQTCIIILEYCYDGDITIPAKKTTQINKYLIMKLLCGGVIP